MSMQEGRANCLLAATGYVESKGAFLGIFERRLKGDRFEVVEMSEKKLLVRSKGSLIVGAVIPMVVQIKSSPAQVRLTVEGMVESSEKLEGHYLSSIRLIHSSEMEETELRELFINSCEN